MQGRQSLGRGQAVFGRLLLSWLLACAACIGCRKSEAPSEPPQAAAQALVLPLEPEAAPVPAEAPQLAATPERRLHHYERACMGTRCTLSAWHEDPLVVERAIDQAWAEIQRLDALMTTWLDTSDVSRINAAAGSPEAIAVAPETFEVLQQSLWVARASEGAFDITVGAFKGLWKFDEDNDGTLPRRSDVLRQLSYVDYTGLLLDADKHTARLKRRGQNITLGGIAKGLIVDGAVAKLREAGLVDFLVQAGGDLYAAGRHGHRDWKVGIQDPRAPTDQDRSVDSSFALISLSNSAFNTSGDYERFVLKDGKRYHHILDPRTGYPVEHTRSVTVLAPTSFLADTLDTAIFVLGVEKGMRLAASVPGVEVVIVDAQNQVHMSPGLRGRLTLTRAPTDRP
jgi:thiamine biosynthesis lipoprotein